MTRFPPLKMSLLAAAGICLTASAALAQVPAPPTATPYPPPPPPTVPDVTPPLSAPMAPPTTAITMPKSADDLTGSVGFGVGVLPIAGQPLVGSDGVVAIKYWMSDTMALVPSLIFNFGKMQDVDATWRLNPEAVLLFTPVKGTSTRMQLGGGLGIDVGKTTAAADTTFSFRIPVQIGVEHFLARWFSLGIAARSYFFSMQTGDPWNISMSLNTTTLLGQLFFYTD